MLIGGKVRRTGAKGVSIMAENAWRLDELWERYSAKQLFSNGNKPKIQ
jgi:hypothetical protein